MLYDVPVRYVKVYIESQTHVHASIWLIVSFVNSFAFGCVSRPEEPTTLWAIFIHAECSSIIPRINYNIIATKMNESESL